MTPTLKQLQASTLRSDKFLTSQIEDTEKRLKRTLARLERKVIDKASGLSFDEDGRLKGPKWTLNQAVKLHKQTARLFEAEYGGYIKAATDRFDVIAEHVIDDFQRLDVPAAYGKVSKRTLKALKTQGYQVYHTLGIEAQNRIAQAVYDSLIAGVTFSELSRRIRGAITGHKDIAGRPLTQYASLYAQDSTMSVYRAMHIAAAEEAGLDHYLYTGTIIEGSRSFCRDHIGKVYSREEIDAMNAESWSGKSGHPLTSCGGYNCRHHWQAVDPDWLKQS